MTRFTTHSLLLASAALVASIAVPAQSAPINYGDFMAATVMYTQVTEDANSPGDNPPLFGAPNISGDSMDFDPIGFNASSSNGSAADITDGQLKFGIMAKPLNVIKNVGFSEQGDTTLAGFGTNGTLTSVTTNLFIDVLEIDGHAPSQVINISTVLAFTPYGGLHRLGTEGGGGPLFQSAWNGFKLVDINAYLTSINEPFRNGATKVQVTLDNTLVATSENGTSSFIAKKDADGITITTNFPEPASGMLALTALLGAFAVRRRS